ncbi:estradiol 17-beta-dehydrogenase 11-like [Chironomus tepperi]|uniref:estradiol 17-beta-dehydrogenase 11-like n=1 Tax=Chironomus tepperi TaxID=113505 RepID=UPI00391EF23D
MEPNSSVVKHRKRFITKKRLLYVLDLLIAGLLLLPMYIHWLVMYFIPRKKKSVKGKLALITGAGSGLGKAMALKLASLGCNIAIADINKSAAEEAAKEVQVFGVKSKAYQVDVTKADQIIQLRSDIEKDFGDVDILPQSRY